MVAVGEKLGKFSSLKAARGSAAVALYQRDIKKPAQLHKRKDVHGPP